ncbi:MAG: COX15/CtaA family protein [Acidobacteriota bacterium]|nr:COX15/CtaA family protein [Acidobacteriota bacterium]
MTGLHRFAILLAVCTLLLVVAGGLVTSNDAGLSVPDWPLSYGKLMPPMEGGILYEHGHRVIATLTGFLTVVMAIWLWRVDNRTWMKRLGLVAVVAVIAQGVLGGLTVIYLLPPAISVSHACLAQLFFSTTVAIAVFTSASWRRGPRVAMDSGTPRLRTLAIAAPILVLMQLALGAAARHKAIGVVYHIGASPLVTGVILWVCVRLMQRFSGHPAGHPALFRSALALLTIAFAQVFLGIAAYMSRIATVDAVQPMPIMIVFTVLHVAVGALTMAASVVLAIQVFRNVRPQAGELAAERMSVAS